MKKKAEKKQKRNRNLYLYILYPHKKIRVVILEDPLYCFSINKLASKWFLIYFYKNETKDLRTYLFIEYMPRETWRGNLKSFIKYLKTLPWFLVVVISSEGKSVYTQFYLFTFAT